MGKVEIWTDKIKYPQAANRSSKVCNLSAAPEHGICHKEVALKIERFYNDEDEEFHISSKMEMLSILQSIADQGTHIALYYGSGKHFVMTTLLGANEHGMWLDVGPFPSENKQLLLSDQITFVSVHQHVKIQFVAHNIENDLFENNEAFYLKMPYYLLRIQRRAFFRTAIPASSPIKFIIPIQPGNPDDPLVMRTVPVMDISGGGIGLLCKGNESTLLPNKTFLDCQILIPDIDNLTVAIEVRNCISFTIRNNVVHKHIGCRFVHLDNHINILLQHYITRLQSESMARRHLQEEQ
jgi:c-di-GMP-binding flagellar brake protein YcgR